MSKNKQSTRSSEWTPEACGVTIDRDYEQQVTALSRVEGSVTDFEGDFQPPAPIRQKANNLVLPERQQPVTAYRLPEQAPCLGGTTNDENVADGCDVVDLMDRQRASLVRRSIISWYPESAEQADLGSLRYHKLLLRARTSESF